MLSLRLDPALNDRVRRAAEDEGTTVSEFIRLAAAERAEQRLGESNLDRIADLIGAVKGHGVSYSKGALAESLSEKDEAKQRARRERQ